MPYITLIFTMDSRSRHAFFFISAIALFFFLSSQFMVVRIRENSMKPTLQEGQWVLAIRGAKRVRTGDIALFFSPVNQELVVKRCILSGSEKIFIRNGWLITPWGNWFLSDSNWKRLADSPQLSPDSFFMVGDNQFHSQDSREYGYVPQSLLVGRVIFPRFHG